MNNDRSLNQRWNMAVIELARPCRRRRSRAYTTTSNSASRVMITTARENQSMGSLIFPIIMGMVLRLDLRAAGAPL